MTRAAYERKRSAAAATSRSMSRAGRDIGDIPPVADNARRWRGEQSLRAFCEAYFPRRFSLAWSNDHLKVIAKIEACVVRGDTLAVAMPRGSGKTSMCEVGAMWAVITGRHPFVFLVGSSADHALTMLESIKSELANNEELAADFPEVCYPIRRLEGESRRCIGQHHHGLPTNIGWGQDELILPTIPGSKASGAIIRVAGITGNIRGAKHVRSDGVSVRPTLAIVDDPQTDESAASPSQCETRYATLTGAILGLAGPGRRTACIVPCTVIQPGDLADRLLDRQKSPLWQGERCKMVYQFPTAEKLWDQYAQIRNDSFRADRHGEEATEFYGEHRAEMDAGAVIAWPARHNPDELSAIQHAMNLLQRDKYAFFAEYQNEPLKEEDEATQTTADQVAAKANGIKRGVAPKGAGRLTAFIDVQEKVLYWLVASWSDEFGGHVVDWGTYPDQGRAYFTLAEVRKTLAAAKPKAGFEAALLAGLDACTNTIAGREWKREDGATMRVERIAIDANWGNSTEIVRAFCRRSPHAALLIPAHGRYVGASSFPLADRAKAAGERVGYYWRMSVIQGQRHVVYDTNHWKSLLDSRIRAAPGDRGSLSLYGSPSDHRMLADHLTAEYGVKTEGRGRTVIEWKLRPGRDNHGLDCLVGAAVLASVLGVDPAGPGGMNKPKRTMSMREYIDAQRKRR